MWRIAWESKQTGFRSNGCPVFVSKKDCEYAVNMLNDKYPFIHHWAEEASENDLFL